MGDAVLYSQVIAQMRRRADHFLAGRLDNLVTDYVFPLPIDLMSTRIIARSRAEGRAMLALQRNSMMERGVIALRPDVTAVDLPRGGRFRVWVDWHEITPLPEGARVSSAVYYCKVAGAELKIEMVDYIRLSTPELQPQFEALAPALTA
jgi:hypothetical protein